MGIKYWGVEIRSILRTCTGAGLLAIIFAPTLVLGADRMVLLEKFTASWCPPCKPSSEAIDHLLQDHPDSFIPMEMFASSSSRYYSPWSRDRALDFYDFPGYPTSWFDGVSEAVSSFNDWQGTYNWYLGKIQARAVIPTDVTIDLTAVQTGNQMYDVTTTVGIEAGGNARTMHLYLAEVLDHYGIYDNSNIVPRNTFRQNVEEGFSITLHPGETTSFTRSVTFDNISWDDFGNVKMVAWAQLPLASGPADVFNAAQLVLADAVLAGDFDGNGIVNGNDLVLWQQGYSNGAGGDADGDGDTDGNDFLHWQQNLSSSSGAGTANAIPEPTTGVLCFVLLASLVARRQSSRVYLRST